STTVDSLIDNYGNTTNLTETVSGGGKSFASTTVNTFQNTNTSWLIGLRTRSTVTKTRDGASVTRTSAASYDPNSGLLATETIEPGDIVYRVVTTHDRSGNPWGLIGKSSQAWRDPATGLDASRTLLQVVAFDTQGRFVESFKNGLGQPEYHHYDPRHGVQLQQVTPNLVTTNWTVDAFARVTI